MSTPKLLHLIDAASPQAWATTLALIGESFGRLGQIEQKALLLGGTALGREAQAAGLGGARTLGVPHGRAVMGWPAVRRVAREMGKFDLIHCWSVGAFTLAAMMWHKTPRLLTLTTPLPDPSVRWLRVLTHEAAGRGILLPITSTLRSQSASARRGSLSTLASSARP